jgi:hypothetical protein
MVTATFRFHGELNEFLPRERWDHEFSRPCARAATVKHMIEALGVPHTEVGTVFVNGERGDLSRILTEGDRVETFPHGVTTSEMPPYGNEYHANEPRRFVADAHLGGLARLLRMAGFDTLYDNRFRDDRIEEISLQENRIALSRDRELLKRRDILRGCYVHALKAPEQFREICGRLNLARSARPFSLCLHCNAPLRNIGKQEVLDRIPPSVRQSQEEFSTCDVCHRIYWKGSHWERMQRLMQAVIGRGI